MNRTTDTSCVRLNMFMESEFDGKLHQQW